MGFNLLHGPHQHVPAQPTGGGSHGCSQPGCPRGPCPSSLPSSMRRQGLIPLLITIFSYTCGKNKKTTKLLACVDVSCRTARLASPGRAPVGWLQREGGLQLANQGPGLDWHLATWLAANFYGANQTGPVGWANSHLDVARP